MKKLANLVAWILALNFLMALGGVVFLNRTGHLNKATVAAIKKLLYPPPPAPPAVAQANPATQPTFQLENLLRKASGMSAINQVNFLQQTFDARTAELDRRQVEIEDQQNQVDLASQKLAADRAEFEKEKQALLAQEQQANKLATDQGFQSTLQLYMSMQPAQVKQIFLTLSDKAVAQYLGAMDARTASKIIRQYKTPAEVARIQQVLELMRKPPLLTENQ